MFILAVCQRFKVSSERLEKPGIEPTTPVFLRRIDLQLQNGDFIGMTQGVTSSDPFKRTSFFSKCVGWERYVGLSVDGVFPSLFRCTLKPCHWCGTRYRSVTQRRLAS